MKNKTIYNLEMFGVIYKNKKLGWNAISNRLIILALFMWVSARAVMSDNHNWKYWVLAGFSCIVLPFFFFVFPSLRVKPEYEKLVRNNGGKDLVTTVEFDKRTIVYRSNAGDKYVKLYTKIFQIVETSKLLIVQFEDTSPLYMDKNGFEGCTKDEVIAFIQKQNPAVKYKNNSSDANNTK